MTEHDDLAKLFEQNRNNLKKVAQRMLGSASEAEDAVQEAWLRLCRTDAHEVENLGGWLTTVVARVCLDSLRARKLRETRTPASSAVCEPDAERDMLLADSIGSALLVVLDALEPAERVAFVLHDMFDVSFEEIAPIVGRSPIAARQLASRARRRVQGGAVARDVELARHGEVVRAFLAASRDGSFDALLAVLDPEVVMRADDAAIDTARASQWANLSREVRGARAVAETLRKVRANGVRAALIDGSPGAAWIHDGCTRAAWLFTIDDDRIVELELILDADHLAQLRVTSD